MELVINDVSTLPEKIDAIWEAKTEEPRGYLGISMIGNPCDRYLWLSFRWIVKEKISGRVRRLLATGHREEAVMVEALKEAGIDIIHTGDDQLELDYGCFVKGHPDGLILSGVPEAEKTEHLWENKTSNDRNFQKLKKEGVKEAKPIHWVQMQAGMLGMKKAIGRQIKRCLYTSLDKDTSEIYAERVRYDEEAAVASVKRAQEIALSERMPEGIAQNPSWWQCKICQFSVFCHVSKQTETVSCRNCIHSTPTSESKWLCSIRNNKAIPEDVQRKGCSWHVFHPDVVPYRIDPERSTDYSAFWVVDEKSGKGYLNGHDGISSKELFRRIMDDCLKAVPGESDNIDF